MVVEVVVEVVVEGAVGVALVMVVVNFHMPCRQKKVNFLVIFSHFR